MIEKKREDIIRPIDVDQVFKVHSGASYKEIKVTSNHVGRKYGEFVVSKVPAK
jgi:ribosomal protein S19